MVAVYFQTSAPPTRGRCATIALSVAYGLAAARGAVGVQYAHAAGIRIRRQTVALTVVPSFVTFRLFFAFTLFPPFVHLVPPDRSGGVPFLFFLPADFDAPRWGSCSPLSVGDRPILDRVIPGGPALVLPRAIRQGENRFSRPSYIVYFRLPTSKNVSH